MAIGTQCPAYALRNVDPQPDASHEFPNALPPTRVRIPRQSQHGAGSGATRGAVIDGADVDAPVRAAGGHARPLRIAQAPVLAGGMTRESSTRDLVCAIMVFGDPNCRCELPSRYGRWPTGC